MANDVTAIAERVPSSPALSMDEGAYNTAKRMAIALAQSNIVPEIYRGNVANVMVAMEYANRLGASVLAVMQNLDIIYGRPSLRSTFLIGTVNATGKFTPIRYRFQGKENSDEWGARAYAKDAQTGEECLGPLVTIATAKKEGWYEKKGSKWQTIPELMLMYRAGGWWTRVYCPELTLGLHTTDEVEDFGNVQSNGSAALDQLNAGLRPALTAGATIPAATEVLEEQTSLV
jgi:hypothetical protein